MAKSNITQTITETEKNMNLVEKPSKWIDFTKEFPEKSKNWILRTIFTILLIFYFCYTIYSGPVLIMLTTLIIQIKCYFEIIEIGYASNKLPVLPWFKSITWYFLIIANYFCYGETLGVYFKPFTQTCPVLSFLVGYHRFVSFCLYILGMTAFMFTVVRKYDIQQYSLLALTHLTLLVIVTQSYMIVRSIFQGMIWLITAVTFVAINDTFAFLCGRCFGRTPLIKLSPKKTWEGFIGAAITTTIYGFLSTHFLCSYKYFVCPMKYEKTITGVVLSTDCTPSYLFQKTTYNYYSLTISTYPFVLRSLIFSLFASLIAPFGGFFASGLKRAFNVKDFGGTIPGHGGILDRFDCQFLMATFTNVYIASFVRELTVEKLFARIVTMGPEGQKEFFGLLKEHIMTNSTGLL